MNGQLIDGDSDDFFDNDFRVDDRNIPQNNRGLYRGISKVTYTGRGSELMLDLNGLERHLASIIFKPSYQRKANILQSAGMEKFLTK